MDELEQLGEEYKEKEEKKPEPTDAIHIDEYGMVVTKENLDKIERKISKLFEQGFTVNIQATKKSEFKMK